MARNLGTDSGILEAALIGYSAQRDAIQKKIDELKAQLGRGAKAIATSAAPRPQNKHRISPEGLKRIRDAQKRRWAAAKARAQSASA